MNNLLIITIKKALNPEGKMVYKLWQFFKDRQPSIAKTNHRDGLSRLKKFCLSPLEKVIHTRKHGSRKPRTHLKWKFHFL